MMMRTLTLGISLIVASAALAADGSVSRSIFGRMDVPAGYEVVVGAADMPAGMSIGRHTHRGTEFGYIAMGEVEFEVEGRPPYRLQVGGTYKIDAGKVHDVRNVGTGPAKAVATWVIEKSKPFAEPAK
jgi:quercetin dioxygenase-like cupin family protein